MAVTKRARMARAMVTAMRVPVDEEGEGGTGHGLDEGDGDRRRTTINQRWDQQRRAVAGKRASTRRPHDHDSGR